MFGMGFGEILVVLLIALIFLGPEKIPSTARTLGKWFYEIKGSLEGFRESFEKDMKEENRSQESGVRSRESGDSTQKTEI